MAYGRRASFEPIRELAFGGIGAAYAPIGTATTDYTRIFTVTNETDQTVYISLDGTDNHIRVQPGVAKIVDVTANKVRDDGMFLPKGTIFYVKRAGAAPTTGLVAIEVMYAAGGV